MNSLGFLNLGNDLLYILKYLRKPYRARCLRLDLTIEPSVSKPYLVALGLSRLTFLAVTLTYQSGHGAKRQRDELRV